MRIVKKTRITTNLQHVPVTKVFSSIWSSDLGFLLNAQTCRLQPVQLVDSPQGEREPEVRVQLVHIRDTNGVQVFEGVVYGVA